MIEILTDAIAFIVVISILVTVHEYGHYIVGRWTGMKVLRFSIGFGKPIWMWRGKGPDRTEYCVASIPLGGYVRFLDSREGDVRPEDEGRAFDHRPIRSRIAVLLAGPAFNFLFAILAYWVLFGGGISVLKPAIGPVEENSYAADAGLEPFDKIVSVDGERAVDWDGTIATMLTVMVETGRIPMVVESKGGREKRVVIDVGEDRTRLTEPGELFKGLGFDYGGPPVVISTLDEEGAAFRGGLKIDDEITHVNGAVVDAFSFEDAIKANGGKDTSIAYQRGYSKRTVSVLIGERDAGNGETTGYLGVGWNPGSSDYYQWRDFTLFESLSAAAAKTWDQSVFTVVMLGKIVTGNVSIKNISGPINIAQIAGASVERGWTYFVTILAVISLSLGILNLLPIPVLDGGQIVYQLIEMVKGSPLTERTQIMGQQIGIVALLLLMSFAFYNDIARNLG